MRLQLDAALVARSNNESAMSRVLKVIDSHVNHPTGSVHVNIGNQRMSNLTWQEERLLRIKLEAAEDKIEDLKDELRHAKGSD